MGRGPLELNVAAMLLVVLCSAFILGSKGETCDLREAVVEDCEVIINSTHSLVHDINTFTNVNITCSTSSSACIEVPSNVYLSITGCRVNGNSVSRCITVTGNIFMDKSYISSCRGERESWHDSGAIYQKAKDSVAVISNSFIEDNTYGAISVEGK